MKASRKRKLSETDNVRAQLAGFYDEMTAVFDHKAFLSEMEARAASVNVKLTSEQYGTLGKIAAAYVAERVRAVLTHAH